MNATGASLVATVAGGLGLALVLGFVASRLRLPPLVGYLVAGILIGPATPGFVGDVELAQELAEIGVMLMMFGVGLHFSLADLMAVRRIAVPGALLQTGLVAAVGAGVARLWGWTWPTAFVWGLSLAVASTVVLIRSLEGRGVLQSVNGRIAVGWLVVQDVVMVLVLVLLPSLAGAFGGTDGGGNPWVSLLVTLAKVAAFLVVMLVGARRGLPALLWQIAGTGSRELFTLAVVAIAVGVAFLSAKLFGVSVALGAFFAGMMMRESEFSHRAAEQSLPLRDAFSVLFFVSVGMLFDPSEIVRAPGPLAAGVAIVMLGNAGVAAAIVLLFRYPLNTALTVGAGLGQIGEFSFILTELGVSFGLVSEEVRSLVVACALISISLNPLLFAATGPAQTWAKGRSALARALERSDDPLSALPSSVDPGSLAHHAVLVGYGRVGSRIGRALIEHGIPFVVAEENRELVEQLRAAGLHAVSGDASDPVVMAQAHVMRARLLVIATPETLKARRMADVARALNPGIPILLRTHTDEEAERFRQAGIGRVFMGEEELAVAMTGEVLERMSGAAGREV